MNKLEALNAALSTAGLSLQNLRDQVRELAVNDSRFNKAPKGAANMGGPWIEDIILNGAAWQAIICAADGQTYEIGFEIKDGKVAFTGEAKEVVRQTQYVEAAGAAGTTFNGQAPLEARAAVPFEYVTPPSKHMWMPAGVHFISCRHGDKTWEGYVEIKKGDEQLINAALDAYLSAGAKPFCDFDHERKEASAWPKRFVWEDLPSPGIFVIEEWSDGGLGAVAGKRYRGFSPSFFVDNYGETSEENPSRLISAPLCMGGLTNMPAFTTLSPLWARQAGAGASPAPNSPATVPAGSATGATSSEPNNLNPTMMTEKEKAELQARNTQLEQKITELQAKQDAVSQAELRAVRAELSEIQAKMKLAEQHEKIIALEAAETKRKEKEADAAVETMVTNGVIPSLDKELRASYRAKFIADTTLIPLMTAMKGPIATGRQTRTGTEVALLAHGDVREGAIRILKALHACCQRQAPIQGLDAESNQKRSGIAKEMAIIYEKEIRGKSLDADGRPTMNHDYLYAPLDAAADTDTLGTLVGTLVAQRTLDLFAYNLPLISGGRIMTDFSDLPSDLNQTVSTRKVLIPSVQTYDTTLDVDNRPKGWATASNGQTTDINITLDELVGVPIPFSMAALSSTQRNLFMEQAPAASYALGKYFMAKLYAVCTAANFNAYAAVTAADAQGIVRVPIAYATYAVALIDFARSAAAKIGAAFDANEVPDEARTLLLNAQYYSKATEDPSIVTFFAGQQAPEVVTEGRLPNLSGFVPIKAPNFPGTQNRVGIALQKNGLLAKTRLPTNYMDILPGAGNGSITQVIEPRTGIAMLLIQYVDNRRGFAEWLPCVILGAAKGDIRGGLPITSQ